MVPQLLTLGLTRPALAAPSRTLAAPTVVTGYDHRRALPIGKYRPHPPRVFGTRHRATVCPDPGAIRRVILKHLAPLRRCLKSHVLARDPNRAGRVVVTFTIGTEGRVTAVRILRSGLADKPTERCLARALGRMRFAKLHVIIHVTYPYLFKPR